jgi:hypothetical protein
MFLRAISGMSFIRGLSAIRPSHSTLHTLALPVALLNRICQDIRWWDGSRGREVGRGGPEGGVQVPGHKRNDREHNPKDHELERSVVADRLGREDQAGYDGHRE